MLCWQTQRFEELVCVKRTPLGACAQFENGVDPKAAAVQVAPRQLQIEPEPESDLIRLLKARTEANAAANAREVQEKTIKNSLPGTYGPFSKEAPVMKTDGASSSNQPPRHAQHEIG